MSSPITNHAIVKRAPDHVATDMAGETVVLDLKSGMYYGMEEVGALIWKTIAEPRTLLEIRDAVMEEYQVDAAGCDRDVMAFLTAMEAAGLVEIIRESAA